jgi:hypothetical protein
MLVVSPCPLHENTRTKTNTPCGLSNESTPSRIRISCLLWCRAATLILDDPYTGTALAVNQDALVVDNYGILPRDVEQVCFSHSAYNDSFEEYLDMTKFYPSNYPAGGMHFIIEDNRLMLHNMAKGSPCAKLKDWRSRLKGAWLISVNGIPVQLVAVINTIFNDCLTSGIRECTLLFSHPYIRHGLTNEGIPQISLDQINPRDSFMDTHRLCHRYALETKSDNHGTEVCYSI